MSNISYCMVAVCVGVAMPYHQMPPCCAGSVWPAHVYTGQDIVSRHVKTQCPGSYKRAHLLSKHLTQILNVIGKNDQYLDKTIIETILTIK